jgi:hypothetical protein
MDADVVEVIRLRNTNEAVRRAARKWRRTLEIVDWLTSQMQAGKQYQVYGFNTSAGPILPETRGSWLSGGDASQQKKLMDTLDNVTPMGGTSLINAFTATDHSDHRRPADPGRDAAGAVETGRNTGAPAVFRRCVQGIRQVRPGRRGADADDRRQPGAVPVLGTGAAYRRRFHHALQGLALTPWLRAFAAVTPKCSACRSSTASAAALARSSCCW